MVTASVELLPPQDAHDEALVEELVGLINAAYAVGEAGLWLAGWTRTNVDEIAAAIGSGGMLAGTLEGRLAGCAYIRPLDARTADLSMVATAPERWGSGVGRELVRSAEELMRTRGMATMQLELLDPKEWVHPGKERLREWYTRLGYRVVRSRPSRRWRRTSRRSSPPRAASSSSASPCPDRARARGRRAHGADRRLVPRRQRRRGHRG